MKYKKYYPIIILIIISILLFLFSLLIKDKRDLSFIESNIKDTGLIINRTINTPINFIDDKIKEYNSYHKLYKKYNKLNKKYNKIKILEAKYDEELKELNDLKKVLNLNNILSDSKYINATVINRNIGYFYNILTIDKGKKKNIKKGEAVITNDGLVGIISKVSNYNSTVKLLTTNDTNNKISVKIKIDEDKYLYGLLSGYDKHNKCFIVEGISDNTKILKDSVVTTAGLINDFPSGIVIGKVDSIEKDNFDLASKVLVKSSVDFDNINYVTVLKKEINHD